MARRLLVALLVLAALFVLLASGACTRQRTEVGDEAPPEPPPDRIWEPWEVLRPLQPDAVPVLLDDGDAASLALAIERSLRWLGGRPDEEEYRYGPFVTTPRQLETALRTFQSRLRDDPSPEEVTAEALELFRVLEAVGEDEDGDVLFTGYYEPVYPGSRTRSERYPVPLFEVPDGTVTVDLGAFAPDLAGRRLFGYVDDGRLQPFPTRGGIREQGGFPGHELAFVQSPVDRLFLEIQGSGALRLEDGGELRVGYAGANGRAYRPVGRLLVEEGKIPREEISMQSIRAYLDSHPEDVDRVLDYNESFVFFRVLDGLPVGHLGVPVTPRRSVATDRRLFPPAALGFLATELPSKSDDGTVTSEGTLERFVLLHDTGGAIRGPGRVDFFWGRGEEAEMRAGHMQHHGRFYVLVPKTSRPTGPRPPELGG